VYSLNGKTTGFHPVVVGSIPTIPNQKKNIS
jgi:hypothetical protein